MSKLKAAVLSMGAVSALMFSFSAGAPAQNLTGPVDRKFVNNPCPDPYLSSALWNETAGSVNPVTRAGWTPSLCNVSNYGTFRTFPELETKLSIYRFQLALQANGISFVGGFRGRDNNNYLIFRKDKAYVGVNTGLVGSGGASLLTENGAGLVNTNGSNVVSQGGGNFVPLSTVVSQGGGNLITSDGAGAVSQGAGNVVAQGSGNGRQVLDIGQTLFQFLNRWAIVSGPQPLANPSAPSTSRPAPAAVKPNPSNSETAQWRQRGPCTDPWVSKAVTEVKGQVNGSGNSGECQVARYNGGSWRTYDELYRGVARAFGR